MAILHTVCDMFSNASQDVVDFKSSLAAIAKEFNTGLKSVSESVNADDLDSKITAATASLDTFYGGASGSGAASQSMQNSGIPSAGVDAAERVLESKGYIQAASGERYWLCNTKKNSTATTTVSGIGAGYAGPEEASRILGRTITDPSTSDINGMLVRAQGGSTSTTSAVSTSTGPRVQSGNVDSLRELAKGCSSTESLWSFLQTADKHEAGSGTVYSTAVTDTVIKPEALSITNFTADYVRKQFNSVLFNDDMLFVDDICYVRTEQCLGFSYDGFDQVLAKRASLASDLNRPVASLPVIRRTVRFTANETVVGRAPVIRTRGCKAAKMTADRFTIGLSVNGIYRIIDVTGDLGSFAAHSTYTAEIIVANINKIFGDLILCEVSGSNFWIRLRDGFGADGTLSIFWSGDTDCADIIGLDNAIIDALETGASTTKQTTVFSLKKSLEMTWLGGSVSSTQQASTSMLLGLQVAGAYTTQQATVLLSGDDYWKAVSESTDFTTTSSTLTATCTKAVESTGGGASASTHIPVDVTNALADYEAQLVFADVTNIGYQEVSILINSFGISNFDKVLRLKPWIWNIDPYKTSSDTMTALKATIKALIASDAISYTDTEWMTVTNPLATNYAAAAQLRLQHDMVQYLGDVSDTDEAAKSVASFCKYSGAVTGVVQTSITASKSTTADQSGTVYILSSATTAQLQSIIANNSSSESMAQLLWDAIPSDMQTTLINMSSEKLRSASVSSSTSFTVTTTSSDDSQEVTESLSSLEDLVMDLLGDSSISSTKRKALAAILEAELALIEATQLVKSMTALYASLLAKLESLSNFAINFSGSKGFKSKYVTCVATGSVSAVQLLILAKLLKALNDMAVTVNKLLTKLHDLVQTALDKIVCMVDKLMANLTGTIQYEATVQQGAVTVSLQCTSTVSLASDFDPSILTQITALREDILMLIDAFKLQTVTFKSHTENINSASSAFSGTLADTLSNLKSLFSKC